MKHTMKNIKLTLITGVLLLAGSCKNFQELQTDPNRTTQTHPSLLLTNIEANAFNTISLGAALSSRMLVYTDGAADEQYYGWQRSSFSRYNQLRQVIKMDEEATRLGLKNYKALVLFFKSFHIIEITKVFGDVPYSQGLQASEGVYSPVYDHQEDIYKTVLDDLKTANSILSADNGIISGDVIYFGDIQKWKKLINSFSLRILISLSNKPGNTNLNVVSRFQEIVNDPSTYPVFESNDDNAELKFYDLTGNRYPYFNNNGLKTAYYMEESFVNLLKDRQDPRLFLFADRMPNGSNLSETDFNAYGGLDGSAPLATNVNRVVGGEASRIDARYYNSPVNEPGIALSYAEVEFTLAEAAARGWISDDPEIHYNSGIRASFDFYNLSTADQDQYLLQSEVSYNSSKAIEMILTQKFISCFMNSGWETFYNNLRTGFPAFKVDGGGVLNNQKIPKRWMYPQDELQLNTKNVEDAIARQYSEGDNINGVMWLLKSE